MTKTDTVIISGGDIQEDFALDFLNKEKTRCIQEKEPAVRLIAADRGLDFCHRNGLTPDFVVGDFDSLSPEGRAYLEKLSTGRTQILRLKPEKDDSDTQSAACFAIRQGAKRIVVLGAMGKRIDHLMANLGLLVLGRELGAEICLVDAWNYVKLVDSGAVLKKAEQFGKYISFFPVGGNVKGVALKGFKYGLEEYCLKPSDSGLTVSNEIAEEQAEITFEKGTLLMIMSRD